MNLWAKRIRQLVALPVALFFFTCEEEASLLGYRNPNPKFQASYVEIPIESSLLLLDSQRTSNYLFQNETNRLLLGQYVDDQLGNVAAMPHTQFYTGTTAKLPAGAIYDSVSLQLQFDLYSYGSRDSTTVQNVSVHELNEGLDYGARRYYFNRSAVSFNPTPLGSQKFTVNPLQMEKLASSNPNNIALIANVPLDAAFGKRIFDKAQDFANGTDSVYITYSSFTELFKGLAIKSDGGDKVLGISPSSAIKVHYHVDTTLSTLDLPFLVVANFTQVTSNRSATDIAGLTQYSQEFNPPNDLRYIQSGTGIYTKLDFGKFFEFCDTIPNVAITSAELEISGVQESVLSPPRNLLLNILNGDLNFKEKFSRVNAQDNTDLSLYNPSFQAHTGTLRFDVGSANELDSVFYVEGDQSPHMDYSSADKTYSGYYSLFFQQLTITAENKRRFRYFVLTPSAPSAPHTKSVNRVIFPKGNIKLKIHYTKPTTPLN